jgi:hypothetical protein
MKARPYQFSDGKYVECEAAIATHIRLNMPGPIASRGFLPVMRDAQNGESPNWTWNGDVNAPTLLPSLRTKFEKSIGEVIVCHSFVTDGMVHFLGDCTHDLKNQVVPLLEVWPN